MKKFISYIFALLFKLFNLMPINRNRITFIMTYDDKFNGSLKYIYEALKKNYPEYNLHIIGREMYDVSKEMLLKHPGSVILRLINILIIKNYYLATSKMVLLNNIFIVGAYLKFKKEVEVIQYWHAVGTFKKFGEHFSPNSEINELQFRANKIYTSIVVNSKQDIPIYAEAFGTVSKSVLALGSPSTDLFFNKDKIDENNYKVRKCYNIGNRRLILYMPTFRENDSRNKQIIEYIKVINRQIDPTISFIVRLHPHIYKKYSHNLKGLENIIDASAYEDENELLCAADVLITDYSSIIYEYSILERAMIFFAFDLDEYKRIRQFYYPYGDFIPGKLVLEVNELIQYFYEELDNKKVIEFKESYYDYQDGKSTQRFIEHFIRR